VTRCDDVGMSAGGEAALGMGKGGDDASWANVNLTGPKNKKIIQLIQLLQMDDTWELTPWRKGVNVVDCMWIFELERKACGYKARLVAKGFRQRYGCMTMKRPLVLLSNLLQLYLFCLWQSHKDGL
jgi:hypothetical protein